MRRPAQREISLLFAPCARPRPALVRHLLNEIIMKKKTAKSEPPAGFFFRIRPARAPSFRTKQADFFFRIRSCECVGLRREKSLFSSLLVRAPAPRTRITS